jgi:hypothetical protein
MNGDQLGEPCVASDENTEHMILGWRFSTRYVILMIFALHVSVVNPVPSIAIVCQIKLMILLRSFHKPMPEWCYVASCQ